MVGGNGGSAFEDGTTSANLQQIRVRCASRVDSLQCVYDNKDTTAYHGGLGGKDDIFYLGKVNIWAGNMVDAIQFQTTKGRLSDKFGGGGGAPYVFRGFNGRERALMGFRGRSANEIDAVEPIWSDTRDLGPAASIVGESKGGNGGNQFDMLQSVGDPLKTILKSITIRSAARIDAIECIFTGGRSSGRQGGNGGGERSFELGANERIVRIEGRAGERIDQLQFITNTERHSDVFGSGGGSSFVWTPPSTGDNMSLLCFQGRAANELDRLAPVWAVDPPVKFQLDIEDFTLPDPAQIGEPKQAWTSEQSTENKTSGTVQRKLTWQRQVTKSSTISLTDSSRTKIGGKVTMSIKVKGEAGVPLLAKSEVEASTSVEVSSEHEWGKSVTDGTTTSNTFTETLDETVTVPSQSRVRGTAVGYELAAHGMKWSGTMTVTYAGGGTKKVDID
ncbi:MAG: hypothetical protein Q9218_002995, partial [Villophora microphyllina]